MFLDIQREKEHERHYEIVDVYLANAFYYWLR